jgi:hypothetical protein
MPSCSYFALAARLQKALSSGQAISNFISQQQVLSSERHGNGAQFALASMENSNNGDYSFF